MNSQRAIAPVFSLVCLVVLFSLGCTTTSVPSPDPTLVKQVTEEQRRLAIQMERERLSKLHDLAWPILQANVDLCEPRVAPAVGVVLTNIDSFHDSMQDQVAREYGIGKKPVVWVLVKGAPAEISGLQLGDEIQSINGNETGQQALAASMGRIRREEDTEADENVVLTVSRDGEQLEFKIKPMIICKTSIHLALTNVVNAWTDGRDITISSGLMRFVEEDSELQYTIAHELSHIVENHVAKAVGQAVVGIPVDAAALAWRVLTLGRFRQSLMHRFSQGLEREADYIGLYMLARAGVKNDHVHEFWNRMAIELPKRIDYGTTHPSSAERYASLRVTVAEIANKIEQEIALLPERKSKK